MNFALRIPEYYKASGGFTMSMLASIARISQTDIEAILRDPGCVGDLLDSPETPKEPKPGFFARIFLGRRSTSQVSAKRIIFCWIAFRHSTSVAI